MRTATSAGARCRRRPAGDPGVLWRRLLPRPQESAARPIVLRPLSATFAVHARLEIRDALARTLRLGELAREACGARVLGAPGACPGARLGPSLPSLDRQGCKHVE